VALMARLRYRRPSWLIPCVVLLLSFGILTVLAGSVPSIAAQNDGRESLRLSGCGIDGALDLFPGQTGTIDGLRGGPEGCLVSDHAGFRYVGCLIVSEPPKPGPIPITRSLNRAVPENACERMS
jgi:hypothetical protein